MKLCIWTEGGGGLGMGHVRRCLVIAHEMRKKGMPVHFLVNEDPAVANWIGQDGFLFSLAPLDETGLPLLDEHGCGLVLMDTKKPVAGLVKAIRAAGKKTILMDNVTEARLSADAVIYPAAVFDNQLDWTGFDGEVIKGASFIPIAEAFSSAGGDEGRIKPAPPYQVLVTMGGSDPNRLTSKILRALQRIDEDLHIRVVIGPAFHDDIFAGSTGGGKGASIEFLRGVNDLAPFMELSHIAITALGTTLYELACMGVPSIIIANYRSDDRGMEAFRKLGISMPLGYYEDVQEERIAQAVTLLLHDEILWKNMSQRGIMVVDGQGALRIADVIENISGKFERGGQVNERSMDVR